MNTAPPSVEVLSLPGCPNAGEALLMAGQVVSAMLPGIRVRDIRLSETEARQGGFPGSPTILVDGRDIEGRAPHVAGVA